MITLNYAKKVTNGYIMNFYADKDSDIASFNASKDFMNYGKPLDGSLLTVIGSDANINYYLTNGSFVVVPTGSEPSVDPLYNLSIDDFSTESGSKLSTDLEDFTFSSEDVWTASVSGADGVTNNNVQFTYNASGEYFGATVGTGSNAGTITLSLSEGDKEEGILYLETANEVDFSTLFADLNIKLYK